MLSDPITAILKDFLASIANSIRKTRLIPISAGTIDTDDTANSIELVSAINRNAITIVEGSVPKIPPIFVPNLSATTVINTTTRADRIKGTNVCSRNAVIVHRGIIFLYLRISVKD